MSELPAALEQRLPPEALAVLRAWLEELPYAELRERLQRLLERDAHDELVDAFSRDLPVGTGGMRGPVGVGPNRFNPLVLGRAVLGHARLLRTRYPECLRPGTPPPVIGLAHDVRVFHDLRGLWSDSPADDALTGLSSRQLALQAARVYASQGFRVLLPDPHGPLLSTPELSFAIRAGGYLGGANLSASHNHPDDNGIKFYNEHGAQLSGEEGDTLLEIIQQLTVDQVPTGPPSEDLLGVHDPALHEAYLECAAGGLEPCDGRQVLFTPLEGTGIDSVAPALERACPGVHVLGGQGDGRFSTVPLRLPNPELPGVFAGALEAARERGARLVLAADPDADRLGAMELDDAHEWRFLDGNRIGSLLLEWLCARGSRPLQGGALVQTAVTSEETVALAREYGLHVIADLPVGFKFIARALDALEAQGRFMVLAFEESHGYLLSDQIREKDAAGAAVVLAHAHLRLRQEGSSLWQLGQEIWSRHGHHDGTTRGLVMTGPTGLAQQRELIAALRRTGGVPGTELRLTRDHEQEPGDVLDFSAPGDRSALEILELRGTVGGAPTRLCTRRSGTEPKIKLYVQIRDSHQHSVDEISFKTVEALLASAGHRYTRLSHALPDHLSLAEKLDLEDRVLPEQLAHPHEVTPGLRHVLPRLDQTSLRTALSMAGAGAHDPALLESLLRACDGAARMG